MTKEQLVLLTVKELKALAKENGLKGYSKLRKAELIEVLAVDVTFEEVCNKAPEELHYWNGENEGLSVFESLNKRNEDVGFDPNASFKSKLNFLVGECNYILEDILCNGTNYNQPNDNTLSGELYHEDKSAWITKVNEIIAYKSYLLHLISQQAEETSEKELNPETLIQGVENSIYKIVEDNGEKVLIDENMKIIPNVYVIEEDTTYFEIMVEGILYNKFDIKRNNEINKSLGLNISHSVLSMLSELAYYKCTLKGFESLSKRLDQTIKEFAIQHKKKEKLKLTENLSVCLNKMVIYDKNKIKKMEFWHHLTEELGLI